MAHALLTLRSATRAPSNSHTCCVRKLRRRKQTPEHNTVSSKQRARYVLNSGRRVGLIDAPDQRPTAGALHPEGQHAATPLRGSDRPTLSRGYQQSAQATEAILIYETKGHEFCERLLPPAMARPAAGISDSRHAEKFAAADLQPDSPAGSMPCRKLSVFLRERAESRSPISGFLSQVQIHSISSGS
jgi:hypothetical protein